jgi:hypothetical protein
LQRVVNEKADELAKQTGFMKICQNTHCCARG